MEMTGSRTIQAPIEVVWSALTDPEVLKQCVPGCESVSGSVQEGFDAQVTQKVGPVKAKFKGRVEVDDIVEHQSLTLNGQGKGGSAGFAKGLAKVQLTSVSDGVELSYDVEAKVGGKLAQLGSRLIDGFAKKMADQFFERFQDAVEIGDVESESDEPDAEKKGWFRKVFNAKA